MAEDRKATRKKIRTEAMRREVMATYFEEIRQAAEEGKGKVAWCTSVGPAELLYAFGFKVHFPENHGAMLGSGRLSNDFIPVASAHGYSPEICSYLTSDIGSYIKGETPLKKFYNYKGLPRPDVLVYNTNQCRDVQDWMAYYAKEFDVPLLGISSPHPVPELTKAHVADVEQQLQDMVEPLEKVAGSTLDTAELKRTVQRSHDGCVLWREVLDSAAHVPSPLTFFDGCIVMGPIVVMRGTQPAIDYYKALKAEMGERVKEGVEAVEGEIYRIYWDGMPIWGRLRAHSELFARLNACIVASTYCNSWVFDDLDGSRPFESMAEAYTKLFINRTEAIKQEYILDMIKRFKVDGILFHDSKTCPNNSNNRYGMPQRFDKYFDISTLVIQGDLCDMRMVSDGQIETAVEAFIEQLEARKK